MIAAIEAEYRRYKALAEAAIAQLPDAALSVAGPHHANSIAMLVWHIAGNLESRFTEFRTSDGEKPWRHRDDEFVPRTVTRAELMEKWERGWRAVLDAMGALTEDDLSATITIRQQPLTIHEALMRSVAHTVYHVGQLVFLAKQLQGERWEWLTIPPGASEAYNQRASMETAGAHTASLIERAGRRVRVEPVALDSDVARTLIGEIDRELGALYPGIPPHGLTDADVADPRTRFVVATVDGEVAGCGALRGLEPGIAEVKRMYVRPLYRRKGVARSVLRALERLALDEGNERVRLETGARQPEAMALYETAGYRPIAPYGRYVGNVVSRCFEKQLSRSQA